MRSLTIDRRRSADYLAAMLRLAIEFHGDVRVADNEIVSVQIALPGPVQLLLTERDGQTVDRTARAGETILFTWDIPSVQMAPPPPGSFGGSLFPTPAPAP